MSEGFSSFAVPLTPGEGVLNYLSANPPSILGNSNTGLARALEGSSWAASSAVTSPTPYRCSGRCCSSSTSHRAMASSFARRTE